MTQRALYTSIEFSRIFKKREVPVPPLTFIKCANKHIHNASHFFFFFFSHFNVHSRSLRELWDGGAHARSPDRCPCARAWVRRGGSPWGQTNWRDYSRAPVVKMKRIRVFIVSPMLALFLSPPISLWGIKRRIWAGNSHWTQVRARACEFTFFAMLIHKTLISAFFEILCFFFTFKIELDCMAFGGFPILKLSSQMHNYAELWIWALLNGKWRERELIWWFSYFHFFVYNWNLFQKSNFLL